MIPNSFYATYFLIGIQLRLSVFVPLEISQRYMYFYVGMFSSVLLCTHMHFSIHMHFGFKIYVIWFWIFSSFKPLIVFSICSDNSSKLHFSDPFPLPDVVLRIKKVCVCLCVHVCVFVILVIIVRLTVS